MKVADTESQSIKINQSLYFYGTKIRKHPQPWKRIIFSSSLILSPWNEFRNMFDTRLWKILVNLIPRILLLYPFSLFPFQSLLFPSILSAGTLSSYQWRTFIYFFPIKFYQKRALHLKVFLTMLRNVDIRFSFIRGNTISKYLRFFYQSFLLDENNKRQFA